MRSEIDGINETGRTRLVLSGDLHIGRSSSRAPDGVRRDDLRAAAAWSRIVDLAVREQADLVCLSGDIADETNRFFEAIGPMEQGVRRLADAEILTVAVAGNHDHDVLVRLADQLPQDHFTLLGRGGVWERLTIEKAGQPALHIDGWSFPRAQAHNSPLDSYGLDRDPAVPILGLVHGDLNVAVTPYGSLDLARLQDLAPAGWLLGHIHAHDLVAETNRPWVLYPGSPQALDPGETGAHGPWVVEVTGGALGVIYGTTASYPGSFKRFEITGTTGTVVYLEDSFTAWQFKDETPQDEKIRQQYGKIKGPGGVADPSAITHQNHTRNFKAFLDALEHNHEFAINGLEARKSVALIQAIYQSAREQRLIKLTYIPQRKKR